MRSGTSCFTETSGPNFFAASCPLCFWVFLWPVPYCLPAPACRGWPILELFPAIFPFFFVLNSAMQFKVFVRRVLRGMALLCAVVLLLAASPAPSGPAKKPASNRSAGQLPGIHFADITQAAGIRFVHNN